MHLRASMPKIFQTQAPNKLLQGSVIFLELCLYYHFGLFCLFKSTKLKTKTAKGTIDGTIELHLFKYKGFFAGAEPCEFGAFSLQTKDYLVHS